MFQGLSHCSTSPPSHRRISLRPQRTSHKGNPPSRNLQLQIWSIQLLSPTQLPLLKRQGTKSKLNHLYIRGMGTKPKYNHFYTRGIRHKDKSQAQSPLHKKDKTKSKQRKDYKLGDHNRPQITLSDHNRSQIIFLIKIRSYR